ncbi:MAG TPA: amylo-alpha-1,6-glucosidase [Candidatus Acidoferrum sp.]|nr:amylo-alpha-1,6-glucosidase [Candidatus Acidoferrum sp.]
MEKLLRTINLSHADADTAHELLHREWLLTNGLGGYASGTISGTVTRRHHGLLIAALPAPLGRVVMLNHLAEAVRFEDGRVVQISGDEPCHAEDGPSLNNYATQFRLENGLPIWRFEVNEVVIEKSVLLVYGQNTAHIRYQLLAGPETARLDIRPSLHFRRHEHDVSTPLQRDYFLTIGGGRYEVSAGESYPPLRLLVYAEKSTITDRVEKRDLAYQTEAERGYPSRGELWSPGFFIVDLHREKPATLIASTEPWKIIYALTPEQAFAADAERRRRLLCQAPPEARRGLAAELVLAADQFIMTPAGRVEDAARARAAGDQVRSVIAGYHWFTDWGRDTMISLEGLTLATGRHEEAGWILRTFAHYIRQGLIPNFFPDGENEGVYHTADATLWFFHALDRYLEATDDRATLRILLPQLIDIVEHHIRGTSFGIGMDQTDGLLRQGAPGYQLTWMDAKVDGWVVTPRRGKAVEINALWYNALRLLETWLREENGPDAPNRLAEFAHRARESFNRRFWFADGGYLYDVVDGEQGDDSACRPNQVFAFSLKHPVLDDARWGSVLDIVRQRLLTPVGLRSLSREHKDYKEKYFGDLRSRDAAYHQGTVWAWLIGPYIDAWLKVHPDDVIGARALLDGFAAHFEEACVGSISEVFDAESPFTPRACVAQAWSVAEVLRCWVKTAKAERAQNVSRNGGSASRPSRRSAAVIADPAAAR